MKAMIIKRVGRQFHKVKQEVLTGYIRLIRHRLHGKFLLQQFFVAAGRCLQSRCVANTQGYTDSPIDSL
jgi:hypothetical protein